MARKNYISANAANQILKQDYFKNKDIFCKIDNKEHKVSFVNVNNKTFSAERLNSSNLFYFENFEQIEYDTFFYRKS